MPVVEIHLLKGYGTGAKTRLAERLTDAVRTVVPADPDLVTVIIHDHASENYMRGRTRREGAVVLPDPERLVRRFLSALEARELDTARTLVSDDFEMRFPGTDPMTRFEDLIAWAEPRYRFVKKAIDTVEICGTAGPTLVFVQGTLSGEWPDGTPFDGIRFIDRFTLRAGRIARQDVWNDIAEHRP